MSPWFVGGTCGCCGTYCDDGLPSLLSDDFSGSVNWSVVIDCTIANTSGEMVLTEVTSGGINGRAKSPDFSAAVTPSSLTAEIELRQVPSTAAYFHVNPSQYGRLTNLNLFIQATATQYFVGGFSPGLGTPIIGTALSGVSPTVGDIWRLEITIAGASLDSISGVAKINGTTHATRSATTILGADHCGIHAECGVAGNVKFDDFSAEFS